MDILKTLRNMGGSAGGVVIFEAAKTLAATRNIMRKDRELRATTKNQLKPYFPSLDLNKIRININSVLPSEYIEFFGGVKAVAMTFGNKIYFKGSNIQNDKATLDSKAILVHELVHSDQARRMGERNFAQTYGTQYLQYGYYDMPLEKEARALAQIFKDNKGAPPSKPSSEKKPFKVWVSIFCLDPKDKDGSDYLHIQIVPDGKFDQGHNFGIKKSEEKGVGEYYFENSLKIGLCQAYSATNYSDCFVSNTIDKADADAGYKNLKFTDRKSYDYQIKYRVESVKPSKSINFPSSGQVVMGYSSQNLQVATGVPLQPSSLSITKRSGVTQTFDRNKFVSSITRAGATPQQANVVSNRVISRIGNQSSISSKELSSMTARSLSRVNTTASRNYILHRNKNMASSR